MSDKTKCWQRSRTRRGSRRDASSALYRHNHTPTKASPSIIQGKENKIIKDASLRHAVRNQGAIEVAYNKKLNDRKKGKLKNIEKPPIYSPNRHSGAEAAGQGLRSAALEAITSGPALA